MCTSHTCFPSVSAPETPCRQLTCEAMDARSQPWSPRSSSSTSTGLAGMPSQSPAARCLSSGLWLTLRLTTMQSDQVRYKALLPCLVLLALCRAVYGITVIGTASNGDRPFLNGELKPRGKWCLSSLAFVSAMALFGARPRPCASIAVPVGASPDPPLAARAPEGSSRSVLRRQKHFIHPVSCRAANLGQESRMATCLNCSLASHSQLDMVRDYQRSAGEANMPRP
jgi:hypothetical protein